MRLLVGLLVVLHACTDSVQAGVQCLSCISSNFTDVREVMGDTSRHCHKRPGRLETVECEEGEMCAFAILIVSEYMALSDLPPSRVVARGCTAYNEDAANQCLVLEDVDPSIDVPDLYQYPEDLEFPEATGVACFCDTDECNDMVDALTSPPPAVCIKCQTAKNGGGRKERKLVAEVKALLDDAGDACINAAGTMPTETCEEDQMCGAMVLTTTNFEDIELKSTRVYSRGCVDKVMPEMNSADMDKCYDGEKFEGIVDELLEGYDFTMEKSTVCVCDGSMENGCNDWKNKFLMKPVDDDDEHEENETMSTVTPPAGPPTCLECISSDTTDLRDQLREQFELNRHCRERPSRITETEACDEGEVCVFVDIAVDEYNDADELDGGRIVARGCVPLGDMEDGTCVAAGEHKSILKDFLEYPGGRFPDVEGSFCLCGSDMCNNMTVPVIPEK